MMMGVENPGPEEAHLYASLEEMENLILDDPPLIAESSPQSHHYHPLSQPSNVDRIPPPPPHSFGNPNSSSKSFIDPPSYADVFYNSFDGSTDSRVNGDGSPRALSRSDSSSSNYLKISVSDPQREQELSNSIVPGGNTYFTYLITTKTDLPTFNGSEFSVRRRFKDVVTLADRLSETHRGFFIPPRPDKNVVESQVMQKQEFAEQRRVALEKYLRRLAEHPAIRNSDDLRVFLHVQGKLPLLRTTDVASRMLDGAIKLPKQLFGDGASAVDVKEVVQPAIVGRDLLRVFRELKQSVANDWWGTKPQAMMEDKEFMEKKVKLQDFELQLSHASQQAESLVKSLQDTGETMGELGLAFVKLTKFETDEAVHNSQRGRAADMRIVATAAVKASRLYRELNAQTFKHLDKLHDYLGLMLAANSAFSDRSSALLTVQTLTSEISSLHSRIEKLEAASSKVFGGDKSRIQKIEELKETLKVTEDARCCAVKEYERIKENNQNELERLDLEMHHDFLSMMKGFVFNQVGYAEKMANVWEEVAEDTKGG